VQRKIGILDDPVREMVEKSLLRDEIEKTLSKLLEREKRFIKLYYFENLNQKQIGEKVNLSHERVRQIIARGVRKIRHPSLARNLIEFLSCSNEYVQNYEKRLTEKKAREKAEKEKRDEQERWIQERILFHKHELKKEEAESDRRIAFSKFYFECVKKAKNFYDSSLPLIEYTGKCKCKDWKASYQFYVDCFEIGCLRCKTKFYMKKGE